jgi:hypothetical protein
MVNWTVPIVMVAAMGIRKVFFVRIVTGRDVFYVPDVVEMDY